MKSPLKAIGLDWFLEPKRMPKEPVYGKNWETPQGVDFGRLAQELYEARLLLSTAERVPDVLQVGGHNCVQAGRGLGPEPVVVVVEGFLLFYDTVLAETFNIKFWMETDCETCLSRRRGSMRTAGDAEPSQLAQ